MMIIWLVKIYGEFCQKLNEQTFTNILAPSGAQEMQMSDKSLSTTVNFQLSGLGLS